MLIRKMLRDVWKNKVPFIAIFFMMFAGNFIFSGITSEYNGMNKSFHSFIKKTNLADAWIMSDSMKASDVQKLKERSLITAVEKRLLLPSTVSNHVKKSVDLYVLDSKHTISKMAIISGETFAADKNGIWLDATFAEENNYKLHDKLKLDIPGQTIEKEIIGFCYSPEYIYNTKYGELLPDHKNTGFAFISPQALSHLDSIPYNQLLVTGTGDIENTIHNVLGTDSMTVIMQEDHPSYSMIRDEITQHKEIGLTFVAVFLFIAVLITITTVHRLLHSQRMQIGILKALGFSRKQLYLHYLSHSTFVCLLGAMAGWCTGTIALPSLIYPIMNEMYVLPHLTPAILELSWTLPMICALISLLIAMIVCRKYLRSNAAKILYSNSVEKDYKELPLSSLRKHLSFYGQWNIRDIFRNRLRSCMTVFGVVGCVSLLFASMGLYTSMQNMSEWTFDRVQTFETKVTGDFSNEAYKDSLLENMYGEELMEASIELIFEGQEKSSVFTGIESQDYLRLYDAQNKKVKLEEGAALSRNIAEELNIETGDRIKWKFSGSDTWYVTIVTEIIRTPMSQGITMMRCEMEKEQIPFQTTSIIGEKPENETIDLGYISSMQNQSDVTCSHHL